MTEWICYVRATRARGEQELSICRYVVEINVLFRVTNCMDFYFILLCAYAYLFFQGVLPERVYIGFEVHCVKIDGRIEAWRHIVKEKEMSRAH